MTIKALAGLVADWYTPEEERDEDIKSQFKLQPLNGMQYIEVMSYGTDLGGGQFLVDHVGRQLLLKYGLVGWKNVEQSNGDALRFTKTNIDILPAEIIAEIGNEILSRSSLVEAERKNSLSQSKLSKTSPDSTVENAAGEDIAMPPTPLRSGSG